MLCSVLFQTNLRVQFFVFREGWCFSYITVIIESWHNETKNSHPKAPKQGSHCVLSQTWSWELVGNSPGGPCFSFQSLVWLQSWGENITSSHLSNFASKTVSTSWRTEGMYFKAATWVEHEINMSDVHIQHPCAVEVDTLWHEADQTMTLHPRHFCNHSKLQGVWASLCTQEKSQAGRMA